jgi:superfamily I DNA and/or RNA helicase
MYDDTFEENNVLFISLTNSVKSKILNIEGNVEDFIQEHFPQDERLDNYLFNHKGRDDNLIGLKTNKSPFALFLKRSENKNSSPDNYFVAIDIQKREDIVFNEHNDFMELQTELKIPEILNHFHKKESKNHLTLADDITECICQLEHYKTPSLGENEEYKKWYAYLTLLEKLIDAKDFFFEADILYTEKKAKVDITHIKDKELLEKMKKARGQSFLFYQPAEVDTSKPVHQWDEKKGNRDKGFGKLIDNSKGLLSFELDDDFRKKFKSKTNDVGGEIILSSFDTNDFIIKSRQYIEQSIRLINQNIKYKDKDKTRLNVANSIQALKISKQEEMNLKDIWDKLSEKNHNENAEDIDRNYINKTLQILKGLLPSDNSQKSFNPPSKLILRVSYFRDQFQLQTLKKGLDKIQYHPLKGYLFGDKKITPIDEQSLNDLEIEYLSKVLNDKQKVAIKKAIISEDIFMIQGPPGTGKTEVISEIAYQEAIRGKKVLITSQANMAVDNAIQRLNHPSLYPVRIIRKDYEPEDGDSLPVKENIDVFYQNRIVKNLSDELFLQKEEKSILEIFLATKVFNEKLISIASRLGIEMSISIDLSNEDDREDFNRVLSNPKNRELLFGRLGELKEIVKFEEVRQDFLEEFSEKDDQGNAEERAYLADNYMKSVNIWGATLFETGKYSFNDLHFDVVIVDEVSKAMPPELVLPILKAKKLILVGDHKQLPPIIKDVSLEDLANETGISLDSLDFEKTVFEKLIENNPDSYVMLNKQYRMHPDIQKAINQFYVDENNEGGLECGLINPDIEKCHQLQHGNFKHKHLIWMKTKDSDIETRPDGGTSFINQKEIDGIEKTLKYLDAEYAQIGKRPSVGVITFYGRQLGELNKLEKRDFWKLPFSERNFANLDLRFGTVDRFQGQEKDIIIVSLVRNNKHHNIGFAKKPNRVNVAFSRAKSLLIIVGNADNFTFGQDEKSSTMYRKIFNIAKKFGTVKGL